MNPSVDADYDVIVVGSGVAGLATAIGLAGTRRVAVVTSGALGSGSTVWAQGGLAAALDTADDAALHATDTLTAAAGIGDPTTTRILADAAPTSIAELVRLGAVLDRDPRGRLALTREGGHSTRRVVHAGGDASGAEVSRTLTSGVRNSAVDVLERTIVRDVLTSDWGGVRSVIGVVLGNPDGSETTVRAPAVVLATGGVGGLFDTTTNPPEVAGAGLGLALRAGACLVDLEFVQFHPTALATGDPSGQVPLISEALRGEGAVLRDGRGHRVMAGRHPLADLAPRDIVARRVDEVISDGGRVWLDATAVEDVARRFPTIVAACRARGVDPAVEPIPVAPTQHFLCGGVRTDEWGATGVIGLYAVGEVAATGVHGANRLASNSLVEGMVFGGRVAARLALDLPRANARTGERSTARPPVGIAALPQIRRTLGEAAGIRRTGGRLDQAAAELAGMPEGEWHDATGTCGNEWLAASAIVAAAAQRRESRGCHWRADHPSASEWWRHRRVVVRLDDGGLVVTTEPMALDRSQLEQTA